MSRNGSGIYTLPEPPFVPLTTISSAAVNSDLSDIATALTGSLARDGQGGMTAVLPLNTAGFSYTSDTNTGMYRTGSDAQAIKCGGTDVVAITTSGASITGDVAASGSIKQAGNALIPVGLGPLPWSRVAAPAGWIFVGQLYSRTTYSALWTVAQAEIALGNTFYTNGDGSTTFGVGLSMPGRIPACNDSISGSAAGILTSTTMTPNGSTIGATGGAQTQALIQGNVPSYNLNLSSLAVTITSIGLWARSATLDGSNQQAIVPSVYQSAGVTTSAFSAGSGTVGGTLPSGGSGTAFDKIQPTIITNYIIFAGV